MSEAFKQCEVMDLFTPERTATFTRPHERDDTVVIATDGKPLHLTSRNLKTIAALLAAPDVAAPLAKGK